MGVVMSVHGIGCCCAGASWVELDGAIVPDPWSETKPPESDLVEKIRPELEAITREGIISGAIASPEDGILFLRALVGIRSLPETEEGS